MRRRRLVRRAALAVATAALVGAIVVPIASAHIGTATISCSSATTVQVNFTYKSNSGFDKPLSVVNEAVYVNGTLQATNSVPIVNDGGGADTLSVTVPAGPNTIKADASTSGQGEVVGFPVIASNLTCSSSPPPPTCTPGSSANFRWHYSANGSSGSWSGTKTQGCGTSFSMGPQDMEGDQKLAPGTVMSVGYDFTVPGNNSTLAFTVSHAQVVFTVACVSGATPSQSTFTVTMPTQTYTVTNSDWYPSGDQHSSLVYQGSAAVPDLCNGGLVRFQRGGTFSATLS